MWTAWPGVAPPVRRSSSRLSSLKWAYAAAGLSLAVPLTLGHALLPVSRWLPFLLGAAGLLGSAGLWVGRQAASLATSSLTDPLTGLSNRREFERHLDREIHRSGRFPATVALLLVDLDRLKAINDQQGHATGDRCLRLV